MKKDRRYLECDSKLINELKALAKSKGISLKELTDRIIKS